MKKPCLFDFRRGSHLRGRRDCISSGRRRTNARFGWRSEWLNSPPLSSKPLRGKVVLVNFRHSGPRCVIPFL